MGSNISFNFYFLSKKIDEVKKRIDEMQAYKDKIASFKLQKSMGDTADALSKFNQAIAENISYRIEIMEASAEYLSDMINTLKQEETNIINSILSSTGE